MFKFVQKLLSSFKIRARISEIRVRIFSFVSANSYANSCTNSYSNSQVNFVHEIRTKFVIFDKLGKISYEFTRIREGYVTNGLYCIDLDRLTNFKPIVNNSEDAPATTESITEEIFETKDVDFSEAKMVELQSCKTNDVYEEVPFENQKCIS